MDMKNELWGFVRVAAAVPYVYLADCVANEKEIGSLYVEADEQCAQVVCFPELSVTGSTCGDLFLNQQLIESSNRVLGRLAQLTQEHEAVLIVGAPLYIPAQGRMYDCAYVMYAGRIRGIVPKYQLATMGGKHDERWFTSGASAQVNEVEVLMEEGYVVPFGNVLFKTRDFTFAVELGEDADQIIPRSAVAVASGADVVFNLAAVPDVLGAVEHRQLLVREHSKRMQCGYVYASAGWGESTTDAVYSGDAQICDGGELIASSQRFSMKGQVLCNDIHVAALRTERLHHKRGGIECFSVKYEQVVLDNHPRVSDTLLRSIDSLPFVPAEDRRAYVCEEVFQIQTTALAHRWLHTKTDSLVIGVSGGLDSTLALLVAVLACDKLERDRKNVVAITMPGFGTTGRTYNNALTLMKELGVTMREISIQAAALQHFEDIGHDVSVHDVTYENTQARERTQILMDVANQTNGLVVGTGDLSELALGWATYNGDHMSMYGVNADIPKTLVRSLVQYAAGKFAPNIATALLDIVSTPVSPELLPANKDGNIAQVTEDIVGPYELHDFFLYYFVRLGFSKAKIQYLAECAFRNTYSPEVIDKWLTTFMRRFFTQQFKRSCLPDGPRVGTVGLSPRGAWSMPSDAHLW